jgi:predicted nucleotidyltransferase
MTATVDLQPSDRAVLAAILRANLPAYVRVWVFGSRVRGDARRYSDLDLALESNSPLNPDLLVALKEELSESDLTIKVDIVDLRAVEPGFRRMIGANMVRWDDHSATD